MSKPWVTLTNPDEIPDELLWHAVELGKKYGDGPIDWGDLIDLLEVTETSHGLYYDLGSTMTSPVITAIKNHVLKAREGCSGDH